MKSLQEMGLSPHWRGSSFLPPSLSFSLSRVSRPGASSSNRLLPAAIDRAYLTSGPFCILLACPRFFQILEKG